MISFLVRVHYEHTSFILQEFLQTRLMSAFCKFYGRYYNLICNFHWVQSVWHFPYQNLDRSWHSDFDGGSLRIHDHETGLMACVTSQQGMLTLPMHLIPPLMCPRVHVCSLLWLVISTWVLRLITGIISQRNALKAAIRIWNERCIELKIFQK
jgi:hypothetical protein